MTTATIAKQRTDALAKGNQIRVAKAQTRRKIKNMSRQDGLREVAALISTCPPHVAKIPVGELLCWVRYVTRRKLPHYLPDSQHAAFRTRPDQILRDIPPERRDMIAAKIERIAATK